MNTDLKTFLKPIFCLILVCVFALPQVVAQSTQKISVPTDVEKWITSTLGRGKMPPLSFVYDN